MSKFNTHNTAAYSHLPETNNVPIYRLVAYNLALFCFPGWGFTIGHDQNRPALC